MEISVFINSEFSARSRSQCVSYGSGGPGGFLGYRGRFNNDDGKMDI